MDRKTKEIIIQHLEELKQGLPIEAVRKFNIDSKYLRRTRPTINGKRESLYKLTDEAIKIIDVEFPYTTDINIPEDESIGAPFSEMTEMYKYIETSRCQYRSMKERVGVIRKYWNKLESEGLNFDYVFSTDIICMIKPYLIYDNKTNTYKIHPKYKVSLACIINQIYKITESEKIAFAKTVYDKYGMNGTITKSKIMMKRDEYLFEMVDRDIMNINKDISHAKMKKIEMKYREFEEDYYEMMKEERYCEIIQLYRNFRRVIEIEINIDEYESIYNSYVKEAERLFPFPINDDMNKLIEYAYKEYHIYSATIRKPFSIDIRHLITMFIKLSHKYQTGEDIEDVDDAVDAVLDDYLS